MFIFEKRTQIPVRITNKNPKLAGIILTQYGGPDGELGASLRYLSQRFTMPDNMGVGLLTDIGTSVSLAPFLHFGLAADDTLNLHFSGRIFR